MPTQTDDLQSLAKRLVEPLRGWFLGYGAGYDAGSWTPGLVATGGGGVTYASRLGGYVRVGAVVHIWVFIQVATTTLAGDLSVATLPFASSATMGRAIIPAGNWELINLSASYTNLSGLILAGSAELRLREAGDNVVASSLQGAQITAGTIIELAGSYLAASS